MENLSALFGSRIIEAFANLPRPLGDRICYGPLLDSQRVSRPEVIQLGPAMFKPLCDELALMGCLLLWLTSAGLPASSKNGLHRGVRGMALSTVEKSNQH